MELDYSVSNYCHLARAQVPGLMATSYLAPATKSLSLSSRRVRLERAEGAEGVEIVSQVTLQHLMEAWRKHVWEEKVAEN